MEDGSGSLSDTIRNCLMLQLNEVELLQEMYPDEISLCDPKVLEDMKHFVEGLKTDIPNDLDVIVKLFIDKVKVEMFVNLPSFYPTEEPDVFLRCNTLNRQQETSLNNALSHFIKENHNGEVFLYSIISWLQDNSQLIVTDDCTNKQERMAVKEDSTKNDKFVRYWIHSHHIYNKKKREEIISKAKELSLTGFCLPGKPGVVCLEGLESDCNLWWKCIKSMCWKKIVIRTVESFSIEEYSKEKKFDCFTELHFQSASNGGKHSDMSKLFMYIKDHNLETVFNEFFGLIDSVK